MAISGKKNILIKIRGTPDRVPLILAFRKSVFVGLVLTMDVFMCLGFYEERIRESGCI